MVTITNLCTHYKTHLLLLKKNYGMKENMLKTYSERKRLMKIFPFGITAPKKSQTTGMDLKTNLPINSILL